MTKWTKELDSKSRKLRPRNPFLCKVDGCNNKLCAKGYCNSHYKRLRNGKPIDKPMYKRSKNPYGHNGTLLCIVEGCGKKRKAMGYCYAHYWRSKNGKAMEDPIRLLRKHKIRGLGENGYISVWFNGESKHEHTAMAIAVLGKPLPKGAVVHHVNGIRHDNRPENLVVCPNNAYHFLIEARTRALETCGHADWFKCGVCKQYDDPSNFRFYKAGRKHLNCRIIPTPYKTGELPYEMDF